ncbi:S-layer family protein [Mangrovibacterium diazotrophicum]|uniref:S-layer family protein n=2 Tax=Mangrovibacterium diazotrophicum TaxID=1261403 RepID=A0A419WAD4_9BACT|nr:S-layer family protein [Mangrovibacterium diazotrophicum]
MINRLLNPLLFSMLMLLVLSTQKLIAGGLDDLVLFEKNEAGFVLSDEGQTASIVLGENDYEGVKYVANLFGEDLKRIGLAEPKLIIGDIPTEKNIVLVGTVGQNTLLDELEESGKLDLSDLRGQWEKSLVQVVENPFPGVDKALVLAGSDKRGTIYAMLNLSRAMGVSPWYWWADVPVDQHSVISIKAGRFVTDSPKVQYRGIFLNDEEPALGGWVRENFGDFNAKFYSHVFELILRLRGNYLWPAMWGKAFFDDDPENGRLADELGIVIGTSHHEPLGRAHDEWRRYGSGPWDYSKNAKVLTDFWTKGMERMKDYETIVTVGMRGDGDEAMSEGTNIALLEQIVRDQRKIINKVTGKKAEETPQMWALYKEVQDYYDKGMRVPDDVTLLLCDDNWGDMRKLPNIDAPKHPGGYGMYYHFDYVGGPRNYKWMNVSQIQRVWEQLNLTYSHGVDRVWIVNVGDLKPMEYPISFFLDMAWNPEQFNAQNLFQHTVDWCAEQFGEAYAEDAARIIDLYTKYNHRVTPELLDENTFSLENYNEFERVRNDYRDLAVDALRLYNLIPNAYKDAFDQLVLFPTNACSNLYEMYYAVAKNHQLAAANNPEANDWADEVQQCFDRDSLLTVHYNQQIAGGKWNHQMDQIRIGYTYWQQPEVRKMPEVFRVEVPEISNSEKVFVEADGYISIEASNFQQSRGSDKIHWEVIPGLGKTGSGITTFPQNEYPAETDSIYLEYAIQFSTTGAFEVHALLSPTLNFNANKGLRYAISIDGGTEQVVNMNEHYRGELGQWQAERIIDSISYLVIEKTGIHHLRLRVLEPGIVLQKILIDCGGLKPSFLGAPQSELKKLD